MKQMQEPSAARPQPAVGVPSPPGGGPGVSPAMQQLLARAAQRKAEQKQAPERMVGAWVDPDPQAITALPSGRHPITRYMKSLAQTKAGIVNRKMTLRHIVAELQSRPRETVTWDDVMAYPWHHVTPDMAREFLEATRRRYANKHTQHMYVSCLRSAIGRCQAARLISVQTEAEILDELPTTGSRGRALHGRRLKPEELEALMKASAQGRPFTAARDSALFALMATTGMRVSEATKLDLADWDQGEDLIILRETKNGHDRLVPVDPRVRKYLAAWLVHRGSDPGPLFTRTPGRCGPDPHLSTYAVLERLKVICTRAGLGTVHTHDFRRTVATTLLRTHDAALVSRLLGHSSLAATMTYDLTSQEEQREAIAVLPLLTCPEESEGD